MRNDIRKNILRAVGLPEDVNEELTPKRVKTLYSTFIQEKFIDAQGQDTESGSDDALPLFIRVQDDQPFAYAIPISGKGLWSTLYGYLALKTDLNTVAGITFYKHGETPGLGAEVEKEWFTSQFVGKKVLDKEGQLVSVKVVKGKVDVLVSNIERRAHAVDGISGATFTSIGVTNLLRAALEKYEPYFNRLRKVN